MKKEPDDLRCRHRRARRLGALAAAACLWLGAAPRALAAGSSPILTLTSVDVFAGPNGARVLAAGGSFNFDDLMQIAFPAGLIVTQGSHFVRFDIDGTIVEGTAASVADGIAPGELQPLLSLGVAAQAPARRNQVRRDQIMVVLPGDFDAGAATVLLYAFQDGGAFLSAPLAVVLP